MRALWRQAGSGPCRCGRGLDRPLLPPSPVAMQTAGREPRLQTPSGDAHWAFSLSSTSNECTSLWVEQRPASGPCSGSSLFWRALTGPWDLAPSPPGAWALRERYGGSCPCSCGKGPPSPPSPPPPLCARTAPLCGLRPRAREKMGEGRTTSATARWDLPPADDYTTCLQTRRLSASASIGSAGTPNLP